MYLFFSPLARWSYQTALFVWTTISALMYGVCCAIVWRNCPRIRHDWSTVVVAAAASPAFFNLLLHGQTSALALACLTGGYIALEKRKPFLAGLALGMLVYKPQLGIVAAAVFVLGCEWRVVAGAIAAGAAQLSAAWMYFGTEGMKAYGRALLSIGRVNDLLAIKAYQMHSLSAFWQLLLPFDTVAFIMYVVSALAVATLAVTAWRSRAPLSLRYSLLLLATALVSPHLYVYDLVILAPAFLLITDWTLAHSDDRLTPGIQRLLYLSYALPLIGAATKLTHVQLSVVAMAILSVMVARAARQNSSEGHAASAEPATI